MNQSSTLFTIAKGLTFAAGLFIVLVGGLAGVGYLLQLLLSSGDMPLDSTVVSAASVVVGIGLGGALAWHGIRALNGSASQTFQPPAVWLCSTLG